MPKSLSELYLIALLDRLGILASQRFALPALGWGRRSRPARKMLRRRKLLEIAAESPASGARFVGRRFYGRIIFSLFNLMYSNNL